MLIDVTRPGVDKAYGVEKLKETLGVPVPDMIFGGNAIFPGGDGYPAKQAGVESIQVSDPDETKRVVEAIRACLEKWRAFEPAKPPALALVPAAAKTGTPPTSIAPRRTPAFPPISGEGCRGKGCGAHWRRIRVA